MPAGILECVLCRRRYSFVDLENRHYFLPSMVCTRCYIRLQAAPHAVSCFAKPTEILPDGRRRLGYDPDCVECQDVCPDRRVCGLIMGQYYRLVNPERLVNRLLDRIKTAMAVVFNGDIRNVMLSQKPIDHVRLLNLIVWSQRYSVSLPWMVDQLCKHYANVRERLFRGQPKRDYITLGIRPAVLTGVRTRQAIEEVVRKTYPTGENVEMGRSDQRLLLLGQLGTVQLPRKGSIRNALSVYSQKITMRRRAEAVAGNHFQRAWRGNPWR